MANTNYTKMEKIIFSVITLGSKEVAIGRARSYNMIVHTNQASTSIDIRVHGDCYISFGIWKSCNGMIIGFWRNTDDVIHVNPSRTIGIISPYITIMKSVTGIGFSHNGCGVIPPRNLIIFDLFNR